MTGHVLLDEFHTRYLARLDEALAESTSKDDLQAGIMREILSSTLYSYNDPTANYLTPESLQKYKQRRGGNFLGIGIKFRARPKQYPVVISPLIGGRAYRRVLLEADLREKYPGEAEAWWHCAIINVTGQLRY